ncbi:MAG: hypothetical protein HQK51_03370 [Oligoflexia bacterium]|nr:hypothetical protein [Oligoflexia bacterium]
MSDNFKILKYQKYQLITLVLFLLTVNFTFANDEDFSSPSSSFSRNPKEILRLNEELKFIENNVDVDVDLDVINSESESESKVIFNTDSNDKIDVKSSSLKKRKIKKKSFLPIESPDLNYNKDTNKEIKKDAKKNVNVNVNVNVKAKDIADNINLNMLEKEISSLKEIDDTSVSTSDSTSISASEKK